MGLSATPARLGMRTKSWTRECPDWSPLCSARGKAESRRHVLPGRYDAEEGDRRAGVPVRGVPDELDSPGSAAWSPSPPPVCA